MSHKVDQLRKLIRDKMQLIVDERRDIISYVDGVLREANSAAKLVLSSGDKEFLTKRVNASALIEKCLEQLLALSLQIPETIVVARASVRIKTNESENYLCEDQGQRGGTVQIPEMLIVSKRSVQTKFIEGDLCEDNTSGEALNLLIPETIVDSISSVHTKVVECYPCEDDSESGGGVKCEDTFSDEVGEQFLTDSLHLSLDDASNCSDNDHASSASNTLDISATTFSVGSITNLFSGLGHEIKDIPDKECCAANTLSDEGEIKINTFCTVEHEMKNMLENDSSAHVSCCNSYKVYSDCEKPAGASLADSPRRSRRKITQVPLENVHKITAIVKKKRRKLQVRQVPARQFCDICKKHFRDKYTLATHMTMHTRPKEFKCAQCDKSFNFRRTLEKHMAQHNGAFICSVCQRRTAGETELARHMEKHLENRPRPFLCNLCPYAAFSKHQLRFHWIQIHDDTIRFACSLCGKGTKMRGVLHRHIRDVHGVQDTTGLINQVPCTPGETLSNSDGRGSKVLIITQASSTPNPGEISSSTIGGSESNTKPYASCVGQDISANEESITLLGSNNRNKIDLGFAKPKSRVPRPYKARRKELLMSNRVFPADVKTRMFVKSNLYNWYNKVPQPREHFCDICKRHFKNKFILATHMNKHTKKKEFKCERCDKTFYFLRSLQIHMEQHNGGFMCNVCDLRLSGKVALMRHLTTHDKDRPRPFLCDTCPYAAFTESTLRLHYTQVHDETIRFTCAVCGKGTKMKTNMRRHMRLMHGVKDWRQ